MDYKKLEKSLKFIDSWLDFRQRQEGWWPGFAVAISYQGKIVFNKSYGFANLEKKEKLTPQHIFRIASHSKTFTATAIMQLVEKGKIDLDDPIVKYLPWLKKHKDERFKKVTVKELLSHGAGVIRDGLDCDFWILKKEFPNRDKFEREILAADLVFKPNKQMKYSNLGYTLLGLVIESASGQSYEDFIVQNILEPLKLSNIGVEFKSEIEDRVVTGYAMRNSNGERLQLPNVTTNIMASATGFYSTSEDLCKYFNAHFIGSGKLLNDESKKVMQKPIWRVKNNKAKEQYALGLIVTPIGKRKVFGHGGGFPGQITDTLCDSENKLIVTALTNCIDGGANDITKGVFSVIDYFQKNYSLKSKKDLSKFEGRLINLWSIIDVVSMGNKLATVSPDVWKPFDTPEILKYVDDNTLKIIKTDGYYSEGELIHFDFDKNGKTRSVRYAGTTILPERL